jgi:hypothetical protein
VAEIIDKGMYDPQDDALFGRDMRHKPPITVALTEEGGWKGSRGRLAFDQMVRTQERNMSEYAIKTLGFVPPGYVIVNSKAIRYDPETALKVGHGRMAIPVKEFARQRRLEMAEQWELLNPKWVGTFFGMFGEDPFVSRRPKLEKAMGQAVNEGRYDEFISQFWDATKTHGEAIERLERRARELEEKAGELLDETMTLNLKINKAEHDLTFNIFEPYHKKGINLHTYLERLREKYAVIKAKQDELSGKAKNIREFINNLTFKRNGKI